MRDVTETPQRGDVVTARDGRKRRVIRVGLFDVSYVRITADGVESSRHLITIDSWRHWCREHVGECAA